MLTGSHDGRIRSWSINSQVIYLRVWSGSDFLGDLVIGNESPSQHSKDGRKASNAPDYAEIPHMGFMVQALAIDPRSRSIPANSFG